MMILANEKRKVKSEKYIEYPKKMDPFAGPSSAQKKQPTFSHIKHDLPYIFHK